MEEEWQCLGRSCLQINFYFSQWLIEGWNLLHYGKKNRQKRSREKKPHKDMEIGRRGLRKKIEKEESPWSKSNSRRKTTCTSQGAELGVLHVFFSCFFSPLLKFLKVLTFFYCLTTLLPSHCVHQTLGENTLEKH